jgi:hypothetical protein
LELIEGYGELAIVMAAMASVCDFDAIEHAAGGET